MTEGLRPATMPDMKTTSASPPTSRFVLLPRRPESAAGDGRSAGVRRLTLMRRIDPWPEPVSVRHGA